MIRKILEHIHEKEFTVKPEFTDELVGPFLVRVNVYLFYDDLGPFDTLDEARAAAVKWKSDLVNDDPAEDPDIFTWTIYDLENANPVESSGSRVVPYYGDEEIDLE